jgi:anti-anti-sigma factor
MQLTLLPLQPDDVLRLRLDGPITLRFAGPEAEPLQTLLGPNCYGHKIELDCEGAQCIDTSGLSWLTRLTHNFRAAGGTLVLRHVPPTVLDVFRFLGLGSFFGVAPGQPHPEGRPGRQAPATRNHVYPSLAV